VLPTALVALQSAGGAEAGARGAGPGVRAFRSSVRSLPAAAAAAARHAGSEVSGVAMGGAERGPDGRWAQLRQRVRRVGRGVGVAQINGDAVPSLAEQHNIARPAVAPLHAESQ